MAKRLSSVSGPDYAEPKDSDLHLAILVARLQASHGQHDNPVAITPQGDTITIDAITSRYHVDLNDPEQRGRGLHYRCPNRSCARHEPGNWGVLHVIKPQGKQDGDPAGSHDKYLRHGRQKDLGDRGCGESILHRVAADAFMRNDPITIPRTTDELQDDYVDPTARPEEFRSVESRGVERERWIGSYRVDVQIEIEGRPVLVEIRYSNAAPQDRIAEYAKQGMPVLEVDVRNGLRTSRFFDESDHHGFMDFILLHAPRRWLYHPDVAERELKEAMELQKLHDAFTRTNERERASDPEAEASEVRTLRIGSMIRHHRLPGLTKARTSIWFKGDPVVWNAAVLDRLVVSRFQVNHESFQRPGSLAGPPAIDAHVVRPSDPDSLSRLPHLASESWRLSQYAPRGEMLPEDVVWNLMHDVLNGRPGVRMDRKTRSIVFHYDVVVEFGLTASIMKLVTEVYSRYDQRTIGEQQVVALVDRWMDDRRFSPKETRPGGGRIHIGRLDDLKTRLQWLIVTLDRGVRPIDVVHFTDVERALPPRVQRPTAAPMKPTPSPIMRFGDETGGDTTESWRGPVAPSFGGGGGSIPQNGAATRETQNQQTANPSPAPHPNERLRSKANGMVIWFKRVSERRAVEELDTPELRASIPSRLPAERRIVLTYKRIHDEIAIDRYEGYKEAYLLETPAELDGETRREFVVDRATLDRSLSIPSPLDANVTREHRA